MYWLQWLILLSSVLLQILVIRCLCRGAYREYPLISVFSAVLLLTTVVDAVLFSGVYAVSKYWMQLYYYRNEAVRQFLLFAVVISLIERATIENLHRMRILGLLGLASILAVAMSLYSHGNVRPFPLLMTKVIRDLSFGSAVLTLLLWLMLISSRTKDRQLLMVTVGLGLEFTGEAIGQSLRQLATYQRDTTILLAGNLFLSVSVLMRLYIWSKAFRPTSASAEKTEEPDGRQRKAFPHPAQTLCVGQAG